MTGPIASQIYASALGLLARREHSLQELQQKLLQRFPNTNDIIINVLNKLAEEGHQSNRRFVESYLRSRMMKGFGTQRLRQELRVRGVDASLVDDVIASLDGRAENLTRIQQVWAKKFPFPPQNPKEKFRQTSFLRYRGFSLQEIHALFDQLEQKE